MFIRKFSRFRKAFLSILGVLGVLVFVGLIFPSKSEAILGIDVSQAIISAIGDLGSALLQLFGTLLGILIELVVKILSYNNFVNMKAPPAVHIGWTIIRDLSNMMFIVILIVIAFGTIMKLQQYHARSLLTKMIIMVVLINFSKTITGIFVDFSQVIMLTFVSAFKDSAPIVLTVGLNLAQMTSFAKESDGITGFLSVVVAIFLANAMLVVAIAVLIAMLMILIGRILMIWILVILSPIAYITSILPNTSRYATRWWQELGKNLSAGPVLAFFLWLALSVISTSAGTPIDLSGLGEGDIESSVGEIDDTQLPKGATEIMNTQNMFNYIITIALLLAGIMLTQEFGVMGGSTLGKLPGTLKKMGVASFTKPFTKGSQVWAWGSRKIRSDGIGKRGLLKGIDFNPANVLRTMKTGFARKREQEEGRGAVSSGERLEKGGVQGAIFGAGAQSWVDNYAQGFLYRHGIKKLKRGGQGNIKDLAAEKSRAEEKVKRFKDAQEQQNTTEAYRDMVAEDLTDGEGELININEEIKGIEVSIKDNAGAEDKARELDNEALRIEGVVASGDLTPAIKKRLEAQSRSLMKQFAESGDESVEKAAQDIEQRVKDNKLSDEEKNELQLDANVKRASARRVRAEAKAFDPVAANEEKTRLETEKKKISDHVDELKSEIGQYDNMEDDPEDDPKIINPKKKYDKQLEIAKARLLAMAESKAKAREALLKGGLTEEQRKSRSAEVDAIDKRIKKYQIDIKNKEDLGQGTDKNTELLREQLKVLRALRNKKTEINPETGGLKATEEERKANQPRIEILEKEEKQFRETANRKYMDQGMRDESQKKENEARKELRDADLALKEESAYRPIDFLANLARRAQTSEASRKIDTSNEDELVALMENAKVRGNVTDAAAVAMQAAKVGHLNEIVMEHRAKENWYEDINGTLSTIKKEGSKLVFAAGDSMSAGVEGLHVFINEVFQKQLGYNRQAALALESDLSGSAEHTGHWTFGQAVGSHEDGQFYQRSRPEQGARVKVERSKRDAEALHRQGNRLAITTERWKDDKDHSKGREGILNEYAISELENWQALTYVADRKRFNSSAATHIIKYNMPVINAIRKKVYATGNVAQRNAFDKFVKDLMTISAKEDSGDDPGMEKKSINPADEIRELQEKKKKWGL